MRLQSLHPEWRPKASTAPAECPRDQACTLRCRGQPKFTRTLRCRPPGGNGIGAPLRTERTKDSVTKPAARTVMANPKPEVRLVAEKPTESASPRRVVPRGTR